MLLQPIPSRPTRLFVCDIDGCLSRGSTQPFSIEMINALHDANVRSKTDPDVPAITFCTGRTMPYVECFMQAIGGYLPALCEGGTVLFEPNRCEVVIHPKFGENERQLLEQMRARIDEKLIRDGVVHEHGKFTHFTLLVAPPLTPDDIVATAEELATGMEGHFVIEKTRTCVHFIFRHLHKGTGLEWLTEYTGIAAEEMAGIGDARPDIPFLSQVGIACAPANAHEDVKAVAHWTSTRRDAEAALEFLDRLIERNRKLRTEARESMRGEVRETA